MNTFKDMINSGQLKRRNAMQVKLDDIHVEPGFNVRTQDERLNEHIESLKDFILGGGQPPPIEVRPREEGGVYVVDGHSRREAYTRARAAGAPIEWLPVEAFQGNDADRVARMGTSQEGLKLLPLEQAHLYKRLRGMGLDVQAIAKLVNKTPQHVGQTLTLADADVDVQQAVAQGTVSASAAVKAVKKHGSGAGAKIIQLAAAKPPKQVTAKGKSSKGTKAPRVTASMVEKKIKLTTAEAKAIDLFIATNHNKWKEVAETLMTEGERRHLEARLADAN